jgi:hypothetical protein
MALMFGRVADGYFTVHGETGIPEAERDQAIVELEDWAARIADDQWRVFLDRLPDGVGDAFESIISNAYLGAYQTTLQIIIGIIAIMIILSFAFRQTETPSD